MAEADPQLLSLLQKVVNPLTSLNVNLRVFGIYSPPEQWKITDEANPNIFGYSINVLGQEFFGGKIQPRKLTEKEQKELQQKSKKGGKKQSKDPKEQQKVSEIDVLQQQRKQRQWDSLPQEQKFYRTQQDPFKAFSLKFPQQQKQIALNDQNVSLFNSKIDSGSLEITLTRKPQISQEEIAKLKKAKSKTLNTAQLYQALYRGSILTQKFEQPGVVKIFQRVKLTFDTNGVPDDAAKIQGGSCYIKIQIQLSQPLNPLVQGITPEISQVIPNFQRHQNTVSPIQKFNAEIIRGIRSISQEYIQCFAKQRQHQQDKKHSNFNNISTLRWNEINKKKEAFLIQFVNSGKFSLLKERISKSIKLVVIDKFRKQKSQSITKQQINATLSQLNLYFQEQFTKIFDQVMLKQNSSSHDQFLRASPIHEDLVLGYEYSRQIRNSVTAPIQSESQIERQMRLANQYQILQKQTQQNQVSKAQIHYMNVFLLNKSRQNKQNYARFCLRSRKFNEAYLIFRQIAQQFKNLQHKMICAVLLIDRSREQQTLQLVQEMIQHPNCTVEDKINYNLLLSFMYEREKDIKNSQKYLEIAQKYYKMKKNPYLKFNPVENPYELPKPSVPKPNRYISQLSQSQSQQIRVTFINILAGLNLYNLVSDYIYKIQQSTHKQILSIKIHIFNKDYDLALSNIYSLIQKLDNSKNLDFLMLKADICYKSDRMFECQQIFLDILQLKPPPSKLLQIYLRLGYTYLHRKSWQDAKIIFQKALDHMYNCSVGWLGLGISNLQIGKYNEAEESLNLCKIYNPLSNETEKYQEQVNRQQKQKQSVFEANIQQ